MRRRSRDPDPGGALSSAGWLFAELALVLMVIAFGAGVSPAREAANSTQRGAAPTPAPSSAPVGLDLCSEKFRLRADQLQTTQASADAFRAELERRGIGSNVRVGLVMLFGISRTSSLAGGTAVSERLESSLKAAALPQLASAEIRPYLGGNQDPSSRGSVDAEVFVVTGDLSSGNAQAQGCQH